MGPSLTLARRHTHGYAHHGGWRFVLRDIQRLGCEFIPRPQADAGQSGDGRMKVFISWSGPRSKAIATTLYGWLPQVIQAVEPWMSAHDIPQGTWWRNELFTELSKATFAVVCLTPENLAAPWLHFEAGVIARELFQKNTAAVCTYLLGLSHADVKGPLAEFQHTVATEEDTRKLVLDINKLQDKPLKEAVLTTAFNDAWPRLRDAIATVGKQGSSDSIATAKRDPNEMIAEVLERVREIGTRLPTPRRNVRAGPTYVSPTYRLHVTPDGNLWINDEPIAMAPTRKKKKRKKVTAPEKKTKKEDVSTQLPSIVPEPDESYFIPEPDESLYDPDDWPEPPG